MPKSFSHLGSYCTVTAVTAQVLQLLHGSCSYCIVIAVIAVIAQLLQLFHGYCSYCTVTELPTTRAHHAVVTEHCILSKRN